MARIEETKNFPIISFGRRPEGEGWRVCPSGLRPLEELPKRVREAAILEGGGREAAAFEGAVQWFSMKNDELVIIGPLEFRGDDHPLPWAAYPCIYARTIIFSVPEPVPLIGAENYEGRGYCSSEHWHLPRQVLRALSCIGFRPSKILCGGERMSAGLGIHPFVLIDERAGMKIEDYF